MKNHKTMSSRKRVLLTIACLLVAFIALGGAAFGVYAAIKHSLKHQFNVKYEVGTNIAAKVTAYYQFEGEEMQEINSITFNASDAESTQNMTTDATNLTLGNGKKTIRLIYAFENIGSNQYSLQGTWEGLDYEESDSNTNNKNMYISFEWYNSMEEISTTFTAPEEIADASKYLAPLGISNPGTTDCLVITFSIADDSKEAFFYSTAENGLAFTLEQYSK